MKKIIFFEKCSLFGKKAIYLGLTFIVLAIILYLLQNRNISNISLSIIALSYFLIWWGGSTWLFFHSLKGYLKNRIIVIGDEIAPKTEYIGTVAKIYGVMGIILAIFFFSLSIIPIIFILNI